MSSPNAPKPCCPTAIPYGKHSVTCEANNAQIRAELGEPASGVWWLGPPIPKGGRS